MSEYNHLTKEERYTLEKLLDLGHTQTDIAETLGRSRRTIYNELKRNSQYHAGKRYDADIAQQKADQRKEEKPKAIRFTDEMKQEVKNKIENHWTPELISHRARSKGRDFVSHETIYLWIYDQAERRSTAQGTEHPYAKLYEYLPSSRRRRKNRNRATDQRGKIPNRTPIDERPDEANNRDEIGHLEGDLVIGKNHRGAILVLTDRKYRFTFIRRLNNRSSTLVRKKISLIIERNPWVKSITLDNDLSFAEHEQLGVPTYFTRPYRSQDKGTVENKNKVIRYKYPKGTDFTMVNASDTRQLQQWINNRPMRLLNYKTPNEFLESYLSNYNVKLVA